MPARANAEWKGGLKGGSGSFATEYGISGEYSFRTRFEDAPGANPEQLIGAAHAASVTPAPGAAPMRCSGLAPGAPPGRWRPDDHLDRTEHDRQGAGHRRFGLPGSRAA